MAFPVTPGSNPETETILKDGWRIVAQNVLLATINNEASANIIIYLTYVNTGEAAPSGLDIPKWKLSDDCNKFDGAGTARDVYLYAVDFDAQITMEA